MPCLKLDEDYLILSTMRSAKGLEFDVVNVIHAAEIEEERRLLYVACTRARDQLYVSHPLRYYYTQPWAKADAHGYAQRSRFLTETVTAHFEQIQTGPDPLDDENPLGRVTTASIRAGVRSLWEVPAPS